MGTILIFKDISGKQLASLIKPRTPEEERLFNDAYKFKIGNTIKFNFGNGYLGYRITGIHRVFAKEGEFGQNDSIFKYEFTLQLIESHKSSA